MLIGYYKQGDSDFDEHYVEARGRVDVLCGLIVSGRMTRGKAVEIYREIEDEFSCRDPDRSELFSMIYGNRISRLCDQFCGD